MDENNCTLDKACDMAAVSPRDLISAVSGIMFEYNVEGIGNMLASLGHPDVVKASIKNAKKPGGVEDRRLLMSHAGFLPVPKGHVINVNTAFMNNNSASVAEKNEEKGMPSFEETAGMVVRTIRGDEN